MDITDLFDILSKVVDKFGSLCSAEDKAKIKEVLMQFFQNGTPPAETMKTPKEDSEMMYSYAASLYESGKYQEALPGFWHLFSMNPSEARYSFGVAACLHKMKRYQEAIQNYFVAARVDPGNPVYWGHAADCYVQLGNHKMACVMLTKTIEVAGNDPKHAKLKQQASLIHETLRKQLDGTEVQPPQKPVSSAAK
jgi:type III secretion system low calcium response chaperone LcrH/SycD